MVLHWPDERLLSMSNNLVLWLNEENIPKPHVTVL